MPHEEQNLAPAGFSAWHSGQTAGRRGQGRPARGAEPGARRVAGVTAGALGTRRIWASRTWASPSRTGKARAPTGEARAGRGGGSGRGRCGRLAANPEPGGEKGAAHAGAALGHPLAGTEGRLAGGVLLEAAGQAGVGSVLGEGLQLGFVLLRQVDVEVAHADDGHAVTGQLLIALRHHLLLDVGRIGRQPEDGPAVADDLQGHMGAHHLEQLIAHPPGDGVVVGDVHRAHQVGDQGHGILDLHGVVAEHPQGDDHPGLRILHVVDAAAKHVARVLTGPDEVQLGFVGVPAGRPVDDRAQSRNLVGVDLMASRAHGGDHLTGIDEHGQLVGVDDGAGVFPDVVIRPLEDDLVLAVVRYRNKFTTE